MNVEIPFAPRRASGRSVRSITIITSAVPPLVAQALVLSGTKAWATNGGTADVMMVMLRTDRPEARRGAKGISTFIVPTDAPGYRPGKPGDKMGLRASNTAAS